MTSMVPAEQRTRLARLPPAARCRRRAWPSSCSASSSWPTSRRAANLAAWLYDLIGDREQADAPAPRQRRPLRRQAHRHGASPWPSASAASGSIYAGLNVIVERLGPPLVAAGSCPGCSWDRRCCLLAVFLVWPAISTVFLSFGIEVTAHPALADGHTGAGLDDWVWGLTDPKNHQHLLEQPHLAGRGHGWIGRPRAAHRRRWSTASSTSRWPRPSSSCRWPSRSWAPRSSGGFVYAWRPGRTCPVRAAQRDLDRASGGSRCHGCRRPPLNTFLHHRHPHLAADRLRHGRALGGHQGRARRDHGGGQPGRRQ